MQQPSTPLGSAREISPRKKKGQISFAQSSFMSSIGDDDSINEKKVQNDIEYMYQALRKSKADNELLMARNRQLATDLEEVLASFKEASLKAKLEQESFIKTLRQEKTVADRRLVKATLKSQDRENLLLDWVNSVVSNRIDENYKFLADLTQRTGVMLPKAHKLAQYICQQQDRPLRTAKGGRRQVLASRESSSNNNNNEEQEEEGGESRPATTAAASVGHEGEAEGFDNDLSVLQNFKKLEDTVSDLASGYANYISAAVNGVDESDAEKGAADVKVFSGSEPHTYHSKAEPTDESRRSEAEQREKKQRERKKKEQEEKDEAQQQLQENEGRSPRSGVSSGRPPKPTSSSDGKKSGSPARGASRGTKASKPTSGKAAAAAGSGGPASRKGRRGGNESNQESDTDNEQHSNPASRGGSAQGGKKTKKSKKPKSRGGSAGDFDALVSNEDEDESVYHLDRVVGEALFDFNMLNMNLRGTCGTPQEAVARSLSGMDPAGVDGSSYSLYTPSRGAAGGSRGSNNNEDILRLSASDPLGGAGAGPYRAPRNGVFNYDGVVDNIMTTVENINRSLNTSSLTQEDDLTGGPAAGIASVGGGRAAPSGDDKYWWDVADKQGDDSRPLSQINNSSSLNNKNRQNEGEEEDDDRDDQETATLLNTAINSARLVANNLLSE